MGFTLYIANIVFSLFISISIIERLYISKKYNKEDNFHLYNNLFSWELSFILISISNVLQIISSMITNNYVFSIIMLKISILLIINVFWGNIIHSEKVMDIITYERHILAGFIPMIMLIVLFFLNLEFIILIFLLISLFPYIIITLFLKNTGQIVKKSINICFGAIFIGMGLIFHPEVLKSFIGFQTIPENLLSMMNIIAPISFIIGTMLIFNVIRKDIFPKN